MVFNKKLIVGSVFAFAALAIFTTFMAVNMNTISADGGEMSAVEHAVINCGDSTSGHGGSAANPPTCEEEVMQVVEDAVNAAMESRNDRDVSMVDMSAADDDGWKLVAEEMDEECIVAVAEGDVKAMARAMSDNGIVNEYDEGQKNARVEANTCVRVSVKVEVRGSASVN